MAKSINGIIEDRIDDGRDAIYAQLRMAQGSPHGAVRDAADMAKSAMDNAFATLRGVKKEQEKAEADERALGTAEDPRQDQLPGTDHDSDEGPSDEDLDG